MIKLKRIYDKPEKSDGFRILVDRLWPRGLSKEKAKVEIWLKEIAPSEKLRKWFSHELKKWIKFKNRYRKELKSRKELIDKIKEIEKENKIITLLFSAKDTSHNNAIVLRDYLKK